VWLTNYGRIETGQQATIQQGLNTRRCSYEKKEFFHALSAAWHAWNVTICLQPNHTGRPVSLCVIYHCITPLLPTPYYLLLLVSLGNVLRPAFGDKREKSSTKCKTDAQRQNLFYPCQQGAGSPTLHRMNYMLRNVTTFSHYTDELQASRPGFESGQKQESFLFTASTSTLKPTQLHIQWAPRALYDG
jgi:hypothetical protein